MPSELDEIEVRFRPLWLVMVYGPKGHTGTFYYAGDHPRLAAKKWADDHGIPNDNRNYRIKRKVQNSNHILCLIDNL